MASGQFERGHRKLGGRVAGTPNHATVAHRAAILKSGLSPIDYLTSVYRDPDEPTSVRVDAARTVCAYVYPKLSSVDVNGRDGQPLVVQIIRFSDAGGEEHQPTAIAPPLVIDMVSAAAESAVTDALAVPIAVATADDDEDDVCG